MEIPANTKRRTSVPGHYEAWREHSDAPYIRRKVFERDRGVCALCGADTAVKARMARETERLWRWLARRHADDLFWAGALEMYPGHTEAERRYAEYRRQAEGGKVTYGDTSLWSEYWVREDMREKFGTTTGGQGHVWEADHIVPVSEGGGGCGIEGYRTLCIECHQRQSALLAGRHAARRKTPAVVSPIGSSAPAPGPIGAGDADQPHHIAPAAGGLPVYPRAAAPTELAVVEHAAAADPEATADDGGRDGPREEAAHHAQDGAGVDFALLFAEDTDPLPCVPELRFDFTEGESK